MLEAGAFFHHNVHICGSVQGVDAGAPVAIIAGAVAGDIVVAYIVYRRTRTAGLDPVRHEAVVVAPTVRLRLGRGNIFVEPRGRHRRVENRLALVSCAHRTVDALKCNGLLYATHRYSSII